jgi:hypothetical protein
VSALEHQNIAQCATHNALPPEILFQIASTLSNPDSLSLKSTCRWFAALIRDDAARRSVVADDKRAFVKRLDLDAYLQAATAEVSYPRWSIFSYISGFDKILCRPWLEAHPITAFTSDERLRSATVRNCIGGSGRLHTCGQESYTLQQLRSLGGNASAGFLPGSVVDLCQTQDHIGDKVRVGLRKLYSKDLQCETTTYCEIDRRDKTTTWSAIVCSLNERAAYICPHMCTSDPGLQQRLWASRHLGPSGLSFSSQVKCMYPDYSTTVRIDAATDVFTIVTERGLGNLISPTDPNWLAQLE